jgi:hypothetical protein
MYKLNVQYRLALYVRFFNMSCSKYEVACIVCRKSDLMRFLKAENFTQKRTYAKFKLQYLGE